MGQVNLVNPAGLGKFPGHAAGRGDFFVFIVLDQLIGFHAEILQLRRYGRGQLGQVHNAQGCGLPAAFLSADGDKVVRDHLAYLNGRQACIRVQRGQPVGVVPADAGFRFLAGDHVIRVLIQHEAVFNRCHQAGVESDKIEPDASLFQGGIDPGQRHALVPPGFFVVAVAADASAAVIPQDQAHPVRRKMLRAVLNEAGQRIRAGHGGVPRRGFKAGQRAVLNLVNLVL